ncbi:hypothetical protein GGF42_007687 [Coemansia sp. RSA 2424]|nr:hypothetical protein GGF42_007687 [Coemansia sp. RSA 2424]
MEAGGGGVVVVTGASRGIGQQVCISLLNALPQLHIVAVARSHTALEDNSERLHIVQGDISDPATQTAIRAKLHTLSQHPLLALINNAATLAPTGALLDTSAAEWTQMLATNLVAPLALSSICMARLQQSRGRIINVTSSASQAPVPGFSSYGMTKAALNYATRALALEYPEVTSIAFYPGVVNTDMHHTVVHSAKTYAAANPALDSSALLAKLAVPIPVDLPSTIIANLALRADPSLSGRYVAYSDPEMLAYHHYPN